VLRNLILYKQYSEAEQREIVFRDITTNEITHTIVRRP